MSRFGGSPYRPPRGVHLIRCRRISKKTAEVKGRCGCPARACGSRVGVAFTMLLQKSSSLWEVLEVTDEEIAQKVVGMVAERLDEDEAKITNETHFVNDLQADSLDMAELVIDLEEVFGIQISDEDAQGIEIVGQAVAYIQEHKKE